jgi:hypothetical protein
MPETAHRNKKAWIVPRLFYFPVPSPESSENTPSFSPFKNPIGNFSRANVF